MNVKDWIKQEQGKHFCACGCGGEIEIKYDHKRHDIPKFIFGHGRRGKISEKKIENLYTYDELYKLYYIDNLSLTKIGEINNISTTVVRRWLTEYNISIKTNSEAHDTNKLPNINKLIELYNSGLTASKIGRLYNMSAGAVDSKLRKAKVLRTKEETFEITHPSKKELVDLYINKDLTMLRISKIYNVSDGAVRHWLRYYNINFKNSSEIKTGIKNPFFGKKHTKKSKEKISQNRTYFSGEKNANWKGGNQIISCDLCGKFFEIEQSILNKNKSHFCSKECQNKYHSKNITGKNHPGWQGGISFEPYCQKFNNELKETIRNNYYRKCALCGKPETNKKHSVHHVDYDKSQGCNGQDILMVPLCTSCHGKTNGKAHRQYYEDLLTKIERTRIMIVEYEGKIDYRSI